MKPKMKNVKITPLPMVKNKKTLYTKLCDSLLLLYIFTRIFGMLPLRLKKQNGVLKLEPQKSDKIYFGIYFVLYGSASIYTILAVSADNQYKIISKLLIFIMTNIMLAHMFLTIIFAFVMRKSFSEYLKKVSNVDEELYRIGISIDYKLIANVLWKLLGLMCASSTIRSLVMIQTVEIDIIEKITLFSAAFIKSLTKYAFMILSLVVCDRFKRINAKLDSIYKDKSIHDADIKNVLKNLRILSKLHYKLCNIVRILDKAFSLQLLLSLGISVADILFHSYYCYLALTLHYYSVNAVMIICPILWLIDEGLEVCLLVRSCSITCEQVNAQFQNAQFRLCKYYNICYVFLGKSFTNTFA